MTSYADGYGFEIINEIIEKRYFQRRKKKKIRELIVEDFYDYFVDLNTSILKVFMINLFIAGSVILLFVNDDIAYKLDDTISIIDILLVDLLALLTTFFIFFIVSLNDIDIDENNFICNTFKLVAVYILTLLLSVLILCVGIVLFAKIDNKIFKDPIAKRYEFKEKVDFLKYNETTVDFSTINTPKIGFHYITNDENENKKLYEELFKKGKLYLKIDEMYIPIFGHKYLVYFKSELSK